MLMKSRSFVGSTMHAVRRFASGDNCTGDGQSEKRPNADPLKPFRVTLIEGQGRGPVVCAAVRKIFKAAGIPVQWEKHTMHLQRDATGQTAINPELLQSCRETGLVLRGPDPSPDGWQSSASLKLRKAMDAYVGVRLFSSLPGYEPFGHVRMVNIRENVSGEYSEIEHTVVPGVVQSIKMVTQAQSESVAKFAFSYAVSRGHKRVTVLHKANVMRLADGMFLRACRNVSKGFADIKYDEERLDKFCLRVVHDHSKYDMLLTPSLYGSLAAAVCGALAGGPCVVPVAAYGPRLAMFETMNDGEADSFGVDDDDQVNFGASATMANPTGLIRAAAWMLSHVGMTEMAVRVDTALAETVRQGVKTPDMGGTASCAQFTDSLIENLGN
ncbi:isocitrate dehydrogenase [NAD] subunit alpha, mitochondrial-like [Adelges cooleyi]|uniref:isocitrate dehydrogenase [NAD] subunit alpha, mitochondrial-like n=1 Tax=Adelges cooleyi TaxID=133065 RepID=UPI00217F6674|nr:isocitrate dehydrogenase [NAD] subunit alpha, mitochondrial-like [Adelges cooleyi]